MSLMAVYNYPENGRNPSTELEVGKAYTVANVEMGQSYTRIFLVGHERGFNSVQFDFFEDWQPKDIFSDPKYNPYISGGGFENG